MIVTRSLELSPGEISSEELLNLIGDGSNPIKVTYKQVSRGYGLGEHEVTKVILTVEDTPIDYATQLAEILKRSGLSEEDLLKALEKDKAEHTTQIASILGDVSQGTLEMSDALEIAEDAIVRALENRNGK